MRNRALLRGGELRKQFGARGDHRKTEGDHGSSQRKWRVQPACQSISNFKPSASLTYLMTRSKLRSKAISRPPSPRLPKASHRGSFRRSNAKEAESRLGRHELSLSQNLTLRGGSVDEKGSEARRCDGIARGVDQCGG